MVERGHEVHVVTYSQKSDEFNYDGIFVHRVTNSHWRSRLNRLFRGKAPLTSQWLDFSYKAFLCFRTLHSIAPFDLLQFPSVHGCGLFTSIFLRVPYCVRISSYAPIWNKLQGREGILDYRLLEWIGQVQLKIAPNIFAPSTRLKDLLVEELGIKNIHIIPTPFFIETKEFDTSLYKKHLQDTTYILFFAGRLSSHKGPQILAKALPKVLNLYPEFKVVFIGKDTQYNGQSMQQYIQVLLKEFNCRLLFFESLHHRHLYPIIQGAEIVVLPSLIDNLPNACLEAMGLGAVVIGTNGSSFDEVIEDGVNGFIVDSNSVKGLENTLLKVLSITDKQPLKLAAQETIKQFLPEVTISQLENYYYSVNSK